MKVSRLVPKEMSSFLPHLSMLGPSDAGHWSHPIIGHDYFSAIRGKPYFYISITLRGPWVGRKVQPILQSERRVITRLEDKLFI